MKRKWNAKEYNAFKKWEQNRIIGHNGAEELEIGTFSHVTAVQEAAFQLLSMYRQEAGTFMYWGSDPDPIQTFIRWHLV